MILQSLSEIGRKSAKTHIHCQEQKIVGRLTCEKNGHFILTAVEKGKLEFGPYVRGTSGFKPGLGFYKWEHLLACVCNKPNAKAGITQNSNRLSYLTTLRRFTRWVAKHCPDKAIIEVRRCFILLARKSDVRRDLIHQAENLGLPAGGFVTLELANSSSPWYQNENILKFWGQRGFKKADRGGKAISRTIIDSDENEKAIEGTCSVTGRYGSLQRLAISLDGFGKDKPKLAAFNRAAYCSRGLLQTYNAPISEEIADLVEKGWQYLVRNRDSCFHLEDQRFVFWGNPIIRTWGEVARDPKVWKDLMASTSQGKRISTAPEGINIIGVGKHQSNACVIAWLQKDADKTAKGVIRWGKWQLVSSFSQNQFFNLTDLLMALRPRSQWYQRREGGRRLLDKHEVRLWRDLLYLSYGEGRIPPCILNRLVERLSAELESFPLDRLVLLNICLCSLNNLEVIDVNNLTERQKNAFNAGRIFNLICYAQRVAIGETGKTLLASNARLAASRPGYILGELITRLHQVYLPKLRRDKTGLYIWIDTLVKGLVSETSFLEKHSPEEMGWFWKGFYSSDLSEEYKRYQATHKKGESNE
jgi:hypothetical protein